MGINGPNEGAKFHILTPQERKKAQENFEKEANEITEQINNLESEWRNCLLNGDIDGAETIREQIELLKDRQETLIKEYEAKTQQKPTKLGSSSAKPFLASNNKPGPSIFGDGFGQV